MTTSMATAKKSQVQRKVSRKDLQEAKSLKQSAYAHFEAAKAVHHDKAQSMLDQAQESISKAIKLNPQDSDSLNLLSRIYLESGQLTSAEQTVKAALTLNEKNGGYWYSFGHICLAKAQLDKAEYGFRQAIKFSPKETRAEVNLAHTLLESGQTVEAFREYRELIKTHSQDTLIRSRLLLCAKNLTADYYDAELEQDLLTYLKWQDVNTDLLSSLCCSMLAHKFRLSEAGTGSDFNDIAQCPLFLSTLKNSLIKNEFLERLIIAMRHELLNHATQNGQINKDFIPLCQGIAHYCWRNEFVLPCTDAESNMAKAIQNMVNQSLDQFGCTPIDLSGALLLLAMYEYWDTLDNIEKLLAFKDDSWPSLTYDFKQLLNERLTLNDFEFEQLTTMPESSVKAQYESYPYPRWDHLDYSVPIDYGVALQHQYPEARLPSLVFKQNLDILVAGCGTGRHAINAAKSFNDVNILAVDICHNSLAYAQKKSLEFGVDNIEFAQGDLTQLPILDQKFDIVECSGVLHHIPHYKKALKNLLNNLKPNGLIKISLYSERARETVMTIRDLFKRDDVIMDKHRVRVIRQAIMQSDSIQNKSSILSSDDFYSMSGTVDLLLHEYERRFTPLSLKKLCDDHDLEFLGFSGLSRDIKREFNNLHGKQSDFTNLCQWEEFEKQYPDSFSAMYQFYCQYKPRLKNV